MIYFIILNSAVKEKVVCDLAEKCYLSNKRVVILVKDTEAGTQIDKLLWIWKQHSFVPHIFTQKLFESFTESVVITTSIETNPNYDILLAAIPPDPDVVKKFTTVIDFAEKYDIQQLENSRMRFKEYKNKGILVTSLQPGEFLHSDLA